VNSIGSSNQRLLDLVADRQRILRDRPQVIFPWRRPCTVKVLLVTDGVLDFGIGDFGMSTFVDVLQHDGRSYAAFDLTLAHLATGVAPDAVQQGAPGIARSITGFEFDNPNHFTPAMYDEVWLFGFEYLGGYHQAFYNNRNADQVRFPADRLGDAELDALTAHMNRGGGIFATGDHATIGRYLCGSVDRIRNMRYWQDFGGGQVSMTGALRNDSNRIGHDPGSQFSDQSDDIPQLLDLKLYSTWAGLFHRARYPHPVLCSRLGRIDVFPDHPHEGEAREPDDLTLGCRDGSPEYPAATGGGPDPAPEVVAWGHVPAGNTAVVDNQPVKLATQAHRFGVVSAYDGHRAGVGRVICDSTWHHFVNVNLIGVVEGGGFDDFPTGNPADPGTPGTDLSKHVGFLASPAGRAALDKIKEYYVNVAVWIAPAERIACMNSRLWWELLWSDRIVEATLERADQRLDEISTRHLLHIGVHARDVLGRLAGACQSVHWILPWFEEVYIELVPHIDPWRGWDPERLREDPPLPFLDLQPLIDVAVGGALVALREAYPYPPGDRAAVEELDPAVAFTGASVGLRRGLAELSDGLRATADLVEAGRRRLR
jgi:hypothetical protein